MCSIKPTWSTTQTQTFLNAALGLAFLAKIQVIPSTDFKYNDIFYYHLSFQEVQAKALVNSHSLMLQEMLYETSDVHKAPFILLECEVISLFYLLHQRLNGTAECSYCHDTEHLEGRSVSSVCVSQGQVSNGVLLKD